MTKEAIAIFDNKLSKEEQQNIYNFCRNQSYKREERDSPELPLTGLTCTLDNDAIVKRLLFATDNLNKVIDRKFINLFLPREMPYYHDDHYKENYYTLLYYVNTENINQDEGGETFFRNGQTIMGIPFIPGRIVVFDSRIVHKATSFRSLDRFTIALKLHG